MFSAVHPMFSCLCISIDSHDEQFRKGSKYKLSWSANLFGIAWLPCAKAGAPFQIAFGSLANNNAIELCETKNRTENIKKQSFWTKPCFLYWICADRSLCATLQYNTHRWFAQLPLQGFWSFLQLLALCFLVTIRETGCSSLLPCLCVYPVVIRTKATHTHTYTHTM